MKNFTLLCIGVFLGGLLFSAPLYADSASLPDGDLVSVELSESKIKVFPNPSDGRFQFTLEYDGTEKVTAKIYDITGKLVKDLTEELVKEDTQVSTHVNLDHPKSGIYFLRVSIGSKVLTKKFVIR